MTIRTSLLLLFILADVSFLYAQDVIGLKNGESIKSKVIEIGTKDVKYKKYENVEGPTYSIEKSKINQIEYENGNKESFSNSMKKEIEKPNGLKQKGYTNITELGLGLGGINSSMYDPRVGNPNGVYFHTWSSAALMIGIRTVNGYKFNPHLSLGLGIGYEAYANSYKVIPLSLDFRWNISSKKFTPTLNLNTGINIVPNQDNKTIQKNYFYINPSVGLKYGKFLFNVGYKPTKISASEGNINYVHNFGVIVFNTGLSF